MDRIKTVPLSYCSANTITIVGQSPLRAAPSSVSEIKKMSQGFGRRRLEPEINCEG